MYGVLTPSPRLHLSCYGFEWVSTGLCRSARTPPSSPAYDITLQANVCDLRAVSDFKSRNDELLPIFRRNEVQAQSSPSIFLSAGQQPLKAGGVTPHVQQEAEAYSSGESKLDFEEYEDEKDAQTAVLSEQRESTVLGAVSHVELPICLRVCIHAYPSVG